MTHRQASPAEAQHMMRKVTICCMFALPAHTHVRWRARAGMLELQQQRSTDSMLGGPRGAHLKDREWGQMGVNRMAGTLGWTMEPPAATEYAVLPVGVASITPSACTCSMCYP